MPKDKFKYHIVNGHGEVIASFENIEDRNICMNALEDFYGNDCGLGEADDK